MFDNGITSESGWLACTISRAGSMSAVMKGVLSRSGLNCMDAGGAGALLPLSMLLL